MVRITFKARRWDTAVLAVVLVFGALVFSRAITPSLAQAPAITPIFPEYEYYDGDRVRRNRFRSPAVNPKFDRRTLNPRHDPRNESLLELMKGVSQKDKVYIKQLIKQRVETALNSGNTYEARWLTYVDSLIGE